VTPQQFLQQHFFCDGHADTFARVAFAGADFVSGVGTESFHIDYAKMKAAGLNLQLMAVYIPPEIARHQGTVTALWIAQFVHRVCDRLGDDCRLVLTRADLDRAAAEGGQHLMLTLEGVAPMLGDLDVLEMFYRFGFRSLGLTHNANNWAAGGCSPSDGKRYGLTADGRTLVKKALGMGLAIDCAHLSRKGFYDLLPLLDGKPLINTHACCAHFVDIERNLTNDQLVKLADTGGVVGITFVPDFLSASKETSRVSSEDVFAHLQHAVELIGIDHVAIGGDFDGVRYLPNDLAQPAQVSNLVQRMMGAGWSEQDIAKVVGGNWQRVLRQLLPE
jgi:membrane dipeptidase